MTIKLFGEDDSDIYLPDTLTDMDLDNSTQIAHKLYLSDVDAVRLYRTAIRRRSSPTSFPMIKKAKRHNPQEYSS